MDVASILASLDDAGFADTSTQTKVDIINEAYWDICGREPWPFLEKYVRLAFNGTTDQASNFPTDYVAAISMEHEDNGVVEFIRLDDFESRFGSAVDPYIGIPTVFYMIAGELHFFPWPSSEDRVRMTYISTPAALTAVSVEADIVIPKQYHRGLLVNGAIYRLQANEDDLESANAFENFYESNLIKCREFCFRQQYQRPQIVQPVDPDDLGWD